MRIKYFLNILFIALVFFAGPAAAQKISLSADQIEMLRTTKISSVPDETITLAWEKLTSSGLSEDQIYPYLIDLGMQTDEVQAFKDRVTLLGLNSKNNKAFGTTAKKKVTDYTRQKDDSVIMPNRAFKSDTGPKKLQVYGLDFFNQLDLKVSPNFSVATPQNYILGPGDQVDIILTGLNETDVEPKISPDGYLQIPRAGLVYLNGITIEQAKNLIKSKMLFAYPAIKTGQTKLTVNLGNTRRIQITINGEARHPSSFTISSLATFFNALYYSGGPNENGSLRYIQLVRNNKPYRTIDFYDFLQNGLMDQDVRLQDQDVIHIPVYRKRVIIDGQVKNPAIYELKDGETLEDLIKFAGGFTDIAFKGTVQIDRINALERNVNTVNASLFSNTIPQNGDLVHISAITNRYTNRVILQGAVYQTGPFELTPSLTLSQLLAEAKGLTPEAYMQRGIIKRTMPDLQKTSVPFVPSDVVKGIGDIALMREDTVMILPQSSFISNPKVTIEGFVKKAAVYPYRKGLRVMDVIAMSGGFADEAADHHVQVSRIIYNVSDTVANQLEKTFVLNLDSNDRANQNIELQPMDKIYVPRLPNYHALGTIEVRGEVVFPSVLSVERRNETALDALKQAGGVTPYGSLENAQVYRKGIRVNVDLTTSSMRDSTSSRNMVILPGDSIYVPRVISYVQVVGAVNNQQYISYNGERFKYYINAAGGTKQNALLKGAYIQYPNGLNRPVRHFLFFRVYPSVKPGSKIIVPEKTPDTGIKIGFGDLGGIAAALTAIISIIAIVHK